MKTKRNLSGIYFRHKPEGAEKFENWVFEDLPEEEQSRVMEGRTDEWLKGLAKQLANTLNEIGEHFEIAKE